MRKISGFVFFFFFTMIIFCNPMTPPHPVISELKFQEGNLWILEIIFVNGPYIQADFDSICISSSGGQSRLNLSNLADSTLIYVITSDSLLSPLYINRDGDLITINSYRTESPGIPIEGSLPFGDYTGSTFPGLLPIDYSICRLSVFMLGDYWEVYSRDKSPTIGVENDTIGTTGILTGFMYDKNNFLITSGSFLFDFFQINFDSNGVYSTNIFSRYKVQSAILENNWEILQTDTIYFDAYPDSVIQRNIHFKDYIVNVEDVIKPEKFEIEIINYPNPFNSSTNFFVKIPQGLIYERGEINIYNVNGEKVSALILKKDSPTVWNGMNLYGGAAASGIYYYQLSLDSEIYKYGSMILLK